jgi:hypothetical protein
MFEASFRRALLPFLSLLDRSATAPNEQPSPDEERTRFPEFPWDLRTIIMVLPEDAPFRYLNLNTVLGLTGVPFDQVQNWRGSDPKDAFDLQFCLDGSSGCATYKRYHSIRSELEYRPDDLFLKLGQRLLLQGQWPQYSLRYTQPEINLELSLELYSWSGFHWWAFAPRIYCHYTTFCDCRLEWRWKGDTGHLEGPALHDHGWGKNMLPLRVPLRVFRYEVMRFPKGAFAISLWTEGPGKLELKNVGLIRYDKQPVIFMKQYECRVMEWDVFNNYAGRSCRVPRRWIGTQKGARGEFQYEALRKTEPRALLGQGFLYGFDYEGQWTGCPGEKIQGQGYVEQLGRFSR